MKKLLAVVAATLFLGAAASAQVTINNTSSCTVSGSAVLWDPVSGNSMTVGLSSAYYGVPTGWSSLVVKSATANTNPCGSLPDGGVWEPPGGSFPPSGSYYICSCGWVFVNVSTNTVDVN